jgi:hypothetical protein
MRCEQEMCPFWGGDGCVCAVLDIDPDEREQAQQAVLDWLGEEG